METEKKGRITQVVGAVLDIRFPDGDLPKIYEAIHIPAGEQGVLTVEVAQHLGDDTVRCIAMGPTDGLVRGMEAIRTGSPIKVPVGEKTLGRIFNVIGNPIDNKETPEDVEYFRFTETLLLSRSSPHPWKFWRQALRSLTFCVPTRMVERSVC